MIHETITDALDTVRHQTLQGILVDTEYLRVDVLEFVLNVRDMERELPIAVVSSDGIAPYKDILHKLENTYLIEASPTPDSLLRRFSAIVARA